MSTSLPSTFETRRLVAERLSPEHLPALRVLHEDPAVMAHLGGVRNEEETQRYLEKNLSHWADHGFGVWMLRPVGEETVIGRVILRWLFIGSDRELEIGFTFMPSYWGKGLATEAAQACIRLARANLDVEELVGVTLPANEASKAVLSKLGFRHEREIEIESIRCLLYRLCLPVS